MTATVTRTGSYTVTATYRSTQTGELVTCTEALVVGPLAEAERIQAVAADLGAVSVRITDTDTGRDVAGWDLVAQTPYHVATDTQVRIVNPTTGARVFSGPVYVARLTDEGRDVLGDAPTGTVHVVTPLGAGRYPLSWVNFD